MDLPTFLRQYEIRSPNVMWFLGAGASAAAGIPTAYNMIWDFKRLLFCSAQKIPLAACADIGGSPLRQRIQQYFNAAGGHPPEDSQEEYSHYFSLAYPDVRDRRAYIERKVANSSPSYGHLALATLLKIDKARLIWTTNFDRMVEDAAIEIFGSSGKLVTATIESADIAMAAINAGRWPVLVKLHGDFQSTQLKNIKEELQEQDAELGASLTEACKRYGMAVVGYSGRDSSVMNALEAGLHNGRGFPFGLFWFRRSDSPLLSRVSDLIAKAQAVNIQAEVIEVETFDELLGDVLALQGDVPAELSKSLSERAPKLTEAPVPGTEGHWPVIRLNALPVPGFPTICRKVVCKIGGVKEVKDAVSSSGASVVATRRKVGVLAFGSDVEVHKAFDKFEITDFDLHTIEGGRLRYETAEMGLINDALSKALERELPISILRRRGEHLALAVEAESKGRAYRPLVKAVGNITGTISKSNLKWADAVAFKLNFRLGRLWLILEPTIWVEKTDDDVLYEAGKEFIRERLASRYNPKWNELLDAWSYLILQGQPKVDVRAFAIGDGVDAAFTISSPTAFSKREGK